MSINALHVLQFTITYFATAATARNCGFTTHALESESAAVEPVVAKERNAYEKLCFFLVL